jgi:tetratricopeptide (TPR) repeat protein
MMQNRPFDALAPLRKGAELDDRNPMAHFALGLAALRCTVAGCDAATGGTDAVRKAFARAVELLPEFPDALSDLAYAEMASGADLTDAERHVLAAVTYLPGRDDYRFHLAEIYIRQRDFPKAQAVLDPIAAASPNAVTKARARQLLGHVAQQMGAAAAARDAAPPPRAVPEDGRLIPIYRKIAPGEQRTEVSACRAYRVAMLRMSVSIMSMATVLWPPRGMMMSA